MRPPTGSYRWGRRAGGGGGGGAGAGVTIGRNPLWANPQSISMRMSL